MMKSMLQRMVRGLGLVDGVRVGGRFEVEAYKNMEHFLAGDMEWLGKISNKVVYVGLEKMEDCLFAGAAQVNPWYVGLMDTAPVVVDGDTMAIHAGWTEFTDYDEATRQTYVDVRTNRTVTNAASKAVYTINQDSSVIGGSFLASASTKSEGASTLLCGGAFDDGDKNADDNYVLQVTYVFTAVTA